MEDIIIVHEVAEAKKHMAEFGETAKRYEQAADDENLKPALLSKVTLKILRYRYKKLQDQFYLKYTSERRIYGMKWELSELEYLFRVSDEVKDIEKGIKIATKINLHVNQEKRIQSED